MMANRIPRVPVREQDPNNPVLKETLEALQSFEKENNLTEKKADVYTDNYKELESIDSDWSFEKFKSAKNNKDIVQILDRTEICDGKDENVLDAKTKDAYLNLLFEGAKLKAETVLAGDKNFAKLSKRERDKLLKETKARSILITCGADGMFVTEPNKKYTKIPVFNKSEVFDVTGAGDTVTAVYTLALAAGADSVYAALIGNVAASLVVKQFGCATTTISELLCAVENIL